MSDDTSSTASTFPPHGEGHRAEPTRCGLDSDDVTALVVVAVGFVGRARHSSQRTSPSRSPVRHVRHAGHDHFKSVFDRESDRTAALTEKDSKFAPRGRSVQKRSDQEECRPPINHL